MVQVGQVEERPAELARVDEALDLAVGDRAHAGRCSDRDT
jgi:hypothetical protein